MTPHGVTMTQWVKLQNNIFPFCVMFHGFYIETKHELDWHICFLVSFISWCVLLLIINYFFISFIIYISVHVFTCWAMMYLSIFYLFQDKQELKIVDLKKCSKFIKAFPSITSKEFVEISNKLWYIRVSLCKLTETFDGYIPLRKLFTYPFIISKNIFTGNTLTWSLCCNFVVVTA